MTRADVLPYVSFVLDDALSADHELADVVNNPRAVFVGWQCGFEPLFVAVFSYLDVDLDDDEAEDIARDYLLERGWFADASADNHADYIIR